MGDAYTVLDDRYEAMKKERISFNRAVERRLAEEEEELELYSWSDGTTTSIPKSQKEDSD
ncbi:MAG: hypothetical protein GPJ51_08355 [Candidatus Heimdallarchaeota archaeon]|nr:hypothetical protein [Candidatus Heimdallarchaeota archaeon]